MKYYRVAGTMESIKRWASERQIPWSNVKPVISKGRCMGLPDGETLIVTGPHVIWVEDIVNEARKHRMTIVREPTIPHKD